MGKRSVIGALAVIVGIFLLGFSPNAMAADTVKVGNIIPPVRAVGVRGAAG